MRSLVKTSLIVLLYFLIAFGADAKDAPPLVLSWPTDGSPVLRFSFGKFKQVGEHLGQHNFAVDVVAENLWGKPIPRADFSLYLFDKGKTRIGEGYIALSNVRRGETVKFQMNFAASGTPASMSLAPRTLPPELQSYLAPTEVSVTINSVPQGAILRVDGNDAGTTPKIVRLNTGKHQLEFSKEGFATGRYPFEVAQDDASGGSVTFELGGLARDTIELRDGSVLIGDLESVTATEIVVRVGGTMQTLDRNRVKRILLTQREAAVPNTSPDK
jgi:hypothetical protein